MIQLTEQQHEEMEKNSVEPICAVDPTTNAQYVLMPRQVYDRLKSLFANDGNWADAGYAAAMEVFARDGWDDPKMDVYDSLPPSQTL